MVSYGTTSATGDNIPRLFKYSYSGTAGSSPPFSCLRCSVCSACSVSTLRTHRAVTATMSDDVNTTGARHTTETGYSLTGTQT